MSRWHRLGDMTPRWLVVLLLALSALVAACDGGNDGEDATTSPPPTLEASPTATPTSTAPTSTPTASVEAPREPRHPAPTLVDPGALPEGASLFVWTGCTRCDAPSDALLRLDAGASEPVTVWEETGGPYMAHAVVDGADLYLFECTVGYCGNVGGSEDEPTTLTLLRSTDRGETFESLGQREDLVWDLDGWGIEPEQPTPTVREGERDGHFLVGDVLLDVRALDDRGGSPDDGPGYGMGQPVVSASGLMATRWVARDAENNAPLSYLTVFRPDGVPLATYAMDVTATAWLDESRLVVTIPVPEQPSDDRIPAILDIFAGTLAPLAQFEAIPGRNTVAGVIGG